MRLIQHCSPKARAAWGPVHLAATELRGQDQYSMALHRRRGPDVMGQALDALKSH